PCGSGCHNPAVARLNRDRVQLIIAATAEIGSDISIRASEPCAVKRPIGVEPGNQVVNGPFSCDYFPVRLDCQSPHLSRLGQPFMAFSAETGVQDAGWRVAEN